MNKDKVFSEATYKNYVEVDYYCTRYGEPVNQELTVKVDDYTVIDAGGASSYNNQISVSPKVKI